jgi:hypothetical protein
MSFTCQLLPLLATVTAYCALTADRPLVSVISWLIVTTKVMLDGPKARSELMTALPVATCLFLVRWLATPGTE